MYCISISHKKSMSKDREKFALDEEEKQTFLEIAHNNETIFGCVLLMTCNRCEIYFAGTKEAYREVEQFYVKNKGISRENLWACAMRYENKAAIKHLYRVVCGLDSAVLGEVEIIRQVRQAYEYAKNYGMTDSELNVIFQSALQLAKEIANCSLMTKLPVSVGTLTTMDALHFCNEKPEPHLLLVGATGAIGTIILRDLVSANEAIRIVGTSRRHKQGNLLFQDSEQVSWIHYDRRYEYVDWADVIISATDSPHYTFLRDNVQQFRREEKELLFIDLAIPRDVDDGIAQLPNCIVKNMDDIQVLAQKNNEKKLTEAKRLEFVIEERVMEMEKTILFRRFLEQSPQSMERLQKKGAPWLLYQLREKLDLEAFKQVINILEEKP